LKVKNVFEEHVTCIFRIEEYAKQETSVKQVARRRHDTQNDRAAVLVTFGNIKIPRLTIILIPDS
jgi:hypothetical protein